MPPTRGDVARWKVGACSGAATRSRRSVGDPWRRSTASNQGRQRARPRPQGPAAPPRPASRPRPASGPASSSPPAPAAGGCSARRRPGAAAVTVFDRGRRRRRRSGPAATAGPGSRRPPAACRRRCRPQAAAGAAGPSGAGQQQDGGWVQVRPGARSTTYPSAPATGVHQGHLAVGVDRRPQIRRRRHGQVLLDDNAPTGMPGVGHRDQGDLVDRQEGMDAQQRPGRRQDRRLGEGPLDQGAGTLVDQVGVENSPAQASRPSRARRVPEAVSVKGPRADDAVAVSASASGSHATRPGRRGPAPGPARARRGAAASSHSGRGRRRPRARRAVRRSGGPPGSGGGRDRTRARPGASPAARRSRP